jgi:polyhydroxyalkanoate synthesis regulator phasin
MTSLRKRVTIGAIGVAVVAGGGIAYAATTSTNPRDAYLNDVATRLNVTPEKLRDAMKGASLDRLEQAVKDGKLTQEQADAMKKKIEAGGGAGPILGKRGFFGGGPKLRGGPGFGGGPGIAFKAVGGVLDDVAKQLGLSAADLRKQLASGKSIADVAKAQNKSVVDIKKTITDSAKSHLDQAVKDGDLTQKQADKVSTGLADHLDDLVSAAPPKIIGGPGLKRGFRGGRRALPGRAFGLGFGPLGPDVDAVAKYLGLSASKLRDELASGKSLADVAKAQNKDLDGLKKVISDRLQTRLDEAVKDGRLTKDQADAIAKKMTAHIDDLLDMSMPRWKHP